jgi:hypothetical protein
MPNEMSFLSHDFRNHMGTVAVTIGAREDNDADIQEILTSFFGKRGMVIPNIRTFMDQPQKRPEVTKLL